MFNRSVKDALKRSFLYRIVKYRRDLIALREWEKEGRPPPPPHIIKERVIADYARRFRTSIFVESGTYLGQTVDAVKRSFEKIFSIEFDPTLYSQAKRLFSVYDHISIIQGDSGEVLQEILPTINQPCLFWLDGHYSGGVTGKASLETPVKKELEHILNHPQTGHVILIDDARCFTGANDYPTVNELGEIIRGKRPDWVLSVENDIIRIHAPEPAGKS